MNPGKPARDTLKCFGVRGPSRVPDLSPEVRGTLRVANAFKGRARGAVSALIDSEAGAVWAVRAVFVFMIERDKITSIDIVMDPVRLALLDVKID